jgi:hypothetical protein
LIWDISSTSTWRRDFAGVFVHEFDKLGYIAVLQESVPLLLTLIDEDVVGDDYLFGPVIKPRIYVGKWPFMARNPDPIRARLAFAP